MLYLQPLYNVVKLKSFKTLLGGTGATPEDGTYGIQALKQLLRLGGKPDGIEAKTSETQAGGALVWKTYRFTFSIAISVKMTVAWKSSSISTGESLRTKIRTEYDLPIAIHPFLITS
jgi:hypothetical protein